jgi:hypothetical protein
MRTTRTYAILEVTPEIYNQIRKLLAEAGYEHAFHGDRDGEVIDMHGIALQGKICREYPPNAGYKTIGYIPPCAVCRSGKCWDAYLTWEKGIGITRDASK